MKAKLLVALALAAILTVGFNLRASAQFSVTISFDENGNSHITNSNGFNSTLPFGLQNDPGPGGLANALTYGLLNPPGLIAGDLRLIDPSCGGCIGDIIRFNPNETISGGSGVAVFYSLIGGASLADIGLPTALFTNVLDISEINGIATYTPTSGQPGFVSGAAGPVTYIVTSDATTIPLPATLPLFASGLVGLGLLTWRRNWKKTF